MLAEITNVRQIEGESRRRWFNDEFFDLVVWQDAGGRITGFQLAYNKGHGERALTWLEHKGYRHDDVDDGETDPLSRKSTPVLLADGVFPKDDIAEAFDRAAKNIDPEIAGFVHGKIKDYAPFDRGPADGAQDRHAKEADRTPPPAATQKTARASRPLVIALGVVVLIAAALFFWGPGPGPEPIKAPKAADLAPAQQKYYQTLLNHLAQAWPAKTGKPENPAVFVIRFKPGTATPQGWLARSSGDDTFDRLVETVIAGASPWPRRGPDDGKGDFEAAFRFTEKGPAPY